MLRNCSLAAPERTEVLHMRAIIAGKDSEITRRELENFLGSEPLQKDVVAALKEACMTNNISIARWLCGKYDMARRWDMDVDRIFMVVCGMELQETALWMYDTFDACDKNKRLSAAAAAFHSRCMEGRTSMAEWMCDAFKLTKRDVVGGIGRTLWRACEGGHVGMVRWLHRKFELTTQDVSHADLVATFSEACLGMESNLETAKWMRAAFGLTKEYLGADVGRIFCKACEDGHWDIAQWLHEAFGLTKRDVAGDIGHAFCVACACSEHPRQDMLEWMVGTFELSKDDIVPNDRCRAFYYLCEDGQLQMAKWMFAAIRISADDARGVLSRLPSRAREYIPEVVTWLEGVAA